ncbi:MAG: ABC transporter permease [Ignavibacteria bacterium]|jgi:putative ABC transport system permease protein
MPQFFINIINFLLVNNHPEAIIGDTEEEYLSRLSGKGKLHALIWLIAQIIILIPLHYTNSLHWSIAMFKNYFKIGYRNLIKEKLISIISMAGLGIGIAVAGLIIIYVHFETSYDKFFDDSDKIYKVYSKFDNPKGNVRGWDIVIGALTPALREIPEIESAARLYKLHGTDVKTDDERFNNLNIYTADSGFFDVFSYQSIAGNIKNTLMNPSSAIITKDIALKLWGNTDVIGNNLQLLSNAFENRIYNIEAVIENPPANSHLTFDILLSHYSQPMLEKFGGDEFLTYFKITNTANPEMTLKLVSEIFEKVNEPRRAGGYEGHAGIIPLEDIHLKASSLFYSDSGKGSLVFVYILSIVTLAILFIAILNFVNLLAAKFQNRFNEIGVRKVVGASRNSILLQFVSEAVLIAGISSIISLIIIFLSMKEFGLLVDRKLDIYYNSFFWIICGIFLLSTFTAITSAVFPALRISTIKCVNILKSKSGGGKVNRLLPMTVMIQFAVVIMLISSVTVIYTQVEYMKNHELGFNPEQLVYFKFTDSKKYEAVKNQLEQYPDIISVTASQSIPGFGRSGQLGKIQGVEGENISFNENRIQTEYIKTFGMKLIAGREFKKELGSDRESVILNEKFVKTMNLTPEEALERNLEWHGTQSPIIGVVADYNYSSFEQNIAPLALSNYTDRIQCITVRVSSGNIKNTLTNIEKTVKQFSPGLIFDYSFVDEIFEQMYRDIETNNTLLVYSALLAIVLSVMGLFAVTLFAVLRRTKEIGVRKILGGSVTKINILLLKDYLVWVLISNIIAWPIAHYALSSWLQNFVIKIDLHLGYYLLAGVVALFIAVITVIYITTRAALHNPVENLRYE